MCASYYIYFIYIIYILCRILSSKCVLSKIFIFNVTKFNMKQNHLRYELTANEMKIMRNNFAKWKFFFRSYYLV